MSGDALRPAAARARAYPLPPPPLAETRGDARERPSTRYVQGFVVFQLVCQLALIATGGGAGRILFRMASFGASLALLLVLRGRGRAHPSSRAGLLALLVIGAELLNPMTSGLAGLAQAGLLTAVIAPLFWVPRLRIDLRTLRQTAMILWAFHTLSASLGVLQVYAPGRFQPPLSSVIVSKGKGYVESLKIVTSSGERVFRPMGLTDTPGGAAISGLYSVLFGMGFFLTRRRPAILAASMGSMGLGMTALYLSQVRSVLVMTLLAMLAVGAVLAWRKDVKRVALLGSALFVMVVAGYVGASSLAGAAVAQRVASLTVSRPGSVYYNNRGHFLAETFTNVLPEHPLGGGLGRWGMAAVYFGTEPQPGDPPPVWVEVQWTGWAVDGGFLLMGTYVAAILSALWMAWRVARLRHTGDGGELAFWGAIVLAHGVGAFALTFSYPLFIGQTGMEFWLLSATLFAAARSSLVPQRAHPLAPA